MMAAPGRRRGASLADINVTPLVDVMLVLLIIFMVTAPALLQELAVNLPKSVVGQGQVQDGIVITLTQAGSIDIDHERVEATQFGARLAAALARKGNVSVFVRADERVPYGRVVDLVGQAKAAGVERVGLVVETTEKPPAKR
ncbi:MAG: biopolymer transporter ExbD [Gemmatimonadota bacterium]